MTTRRIRWVFDDVSAAAILRQSFAEAITLKRGLVGVKPDRFSYWLFNILGLLPGDQFDDLYPGTGAVYTAWQNWVLGGGWKIKQSIKVDNSLVVA